MNFIRVKSTYCTQSVYYKTICSLTHMYERECVLFAFVGGGWLAHLFVRSHTHSLRFRTDRSSARSKNIRITRKYAFNVYLSVAIVAHETHLDCFRMLLCQTVNRRTMSCVCLYRICKFFVVRSTTIHSVLAVLRAHAMH